MPLIKRSDLYLNKDKLLELIQKYQLDPAMVRVFGYLADAILDATADLNLLIVITEHSIALTNQDLAKFEREFKVLVKGNLHLDTLNTLSHRLQNRSAFKRDPDGEIKRIIQVSKPILDVLKDGEELYKNYSAIVKLTQSLENLNLSAPIVELSYEKTLKLIELSRFYWLFEASGYTKKEELYSVLTDEQEAILRYSRKFNLHFVASNGDLETVSHLLNVEPNALNSQAASHGSTALAKAVFARHCHVANFLLDKGADPTIKNKQEKTAFDNAEQSLLKNFHMPAYKELAKRLAKDARAPENYRAKVLGYEGSSMKETIQLSDDSYPDAEEMVTLPCEALDKLVNALIEMIAFLPEKEQVKIRQRLDSAFKTIPEQKAWSPTLFKPGVNK